MGMCSIHNYSPHVILNLQMINIKFSFNIMHMVIFYIFK